MKKIYLCALALSVGSLSFGQQLNKRTFAEEKSNFTLNTAQPTTVGDVSFNSKAPGDILWSEDFTGGLPAGWTSVDNTSNNFLWVLDPGTANVIAEFTDVTPIASNSGGNYMLINGDGYNQPVSTGTTDLDAYFQTDAITIPAVSGVSVNFQQKFRRCCAITPSPEVVLAVSTDPAFASNVQEFDIIGGIAGNVQSPDPMDMSINISSVAANQTTIYLRWHIKSGTSHYYWMIDDIELVESVTNDIVASSASAHFFGVEYSRIPVSQVQPMSASMIYNNIGSADQTNSNLTVTIDDGTTATEYSTPNTTIASLENDTIEWDSLWTPPAIIGETYTVTLDVMSEDSTDSTPANNTYTMNPFTVTSGIMALDDYSTTPGSDGAANVPSGGTEYEAGNQFDCTVDAPLYAIEVVTGSATPPGTFVDVVLYQNDFSVTPSTYTEVWRSASYTTTAADVNTARKFYDTPGTPIANLVSGETYTAAVHSYIDYEFATSGLGPLPGTPTATHSRISHPSLANPDASSTFSLTSTPMIRLDFDITTNVEIANETTEFSVFPNPSKGIFTINLDADAAKTVNIAVKNVVGQTILNKTVNVAGKTTETLSLTDYSKGVYFLTVDNKTVKLVVE